MPRISAEAQSAAAWRSKGEHPKPARHLGREAKALWTEIVQSRPLGFFKPGSLQLLEAFVVHTVQLRRVAEQLDCTDVGDPYYQDLVGISTKLGSSVAQLAAKLRLSIQSALRTESGELDEKPAAVSDLLGGARPGMGKPARMN